MQPPRRVGRYAVYGEISSGGMGSVNYGRLIGPVGFARTVAIKRLHPQFAKDPEFVAMFIDEARLAARIRHPNVVQTTDVVALEEEVFLVMDFVQGEALSKLARVAREREQPIPVEVVSAIIVGMLHGLHAAHEATNERGESLQIVHRDVSPQNVLVGVDGVARVLDFGVAKAAGRAISTRDGQIKGKIAYMSPEQLRAQKLDRRSDIFAAGVVLWEALTGERLFAAESEGAVVANVLDLPITPPSERQKLPKALDSLVLKALERNRVMRFETAEAMALELEAIVPMASTSRVARFVRDLAGDTIDKRTKIIAAIEEASDDDVRALASVPDLDPSDVLAADATKSDAAVQATQPSSISVSAPARQGAPRRRAAPWLAFAGGLLVAALAVGAYALGRTRAAPVALASASATPTALPSASASAAAELVPSASAAIESATSVVAVPPRTTSVAAPHATRNCGVRTYFDSAGIKHFTSNCP